MAMIRETLIWITLLVFSIINTISVLLDTGTILNIPLWLSWLLFWGITFIIVLILLFRKYLQKRYSTYELIGNDDLNLKSNEYFFQSPLYIVDNQVVPVYGFENITYTPTYFNKMHKFVSLFGFYPIYSTYLTSENNEVKIIPQNAFSLRYKYNVYLNGKFIGIFEMRKLFKEKGIKQQLPYIFKSDNEQYSFNNAYMSTQTTISDIKNKIVFQANRSFFDFSKNKSTIKRGEKHTITLTSSHCCSELLLALYIQAIINKQSQKGS
ncbi:hypothetical protein [Staphylococcus delphini]|uniref:DUF3137 domain-containing protein n=2 Tax=Staphylococcus delphini TaxID=53344 RepID=A0ABX9NC36_9STAP|nr:hypothetical protein [Staphylococcus delphini]PNZ87552.1 hypothetical protein CD148_13415 [Staphylococcus delphini]RIZ50575.1 hypothetical protein CDL68_11225 [Staphylococcus delphini]VED62133.1 Uncharacterised protein [Staphylococcus delphini]